MKKLIFCIMALAVAMTAKADDDITEITVGSVSELQTLASKVNDGTYTKITVTLTDNLDLENKLWTPIGTTDKPFVGTFNGGNHTISNLKVYIDETETYNGNVAGLFGKIGEGGMVKDVHISSNDIGSIGIEKTSTEGASCSVGAIAGYNNGTIVGCSNATDVIGSLANASVGGITGENGSTGVIQNCYNLGSVTSSVSTGNKLGGIVGNNNKTVQNCFVKATISEKGSYGKISGNSGGTVTGCFYLNGSTSDYAVEDLLVLNDASANSFSAPDNKHVLLDGRTLYADNGWNTICVPFDIPAGAEGYSPIAGATVMTLSSSSFSAGTLTLTFANATSIVAGKPYIVKWNKEISGNLLNPVFLGVTVSTTTATSVTTTYTDFIGSFSPTSFDPGDRTLLYLGAANTLYYPNAANNEDGKYHLNACRAYFKLNDITAGDVIHSTRMTFEDNETTGIIEAEANSSLFTHNSSLSDWFDLSGRKVSKPTTKGLYIHNGRKIVIK